MNNCSAISIRLILLSSGSFTILAIYCLVTDCKSVTWHKSVAWYKNSSDNEMQRPKWRRSSSSTERLPSHCTFLCFRKFVAPFHRNAPQDLSVVLQFSLFGLIRTTKATSRQCLRIGCIMPLDWTPVMTFCDQIYKRKVHPWRIKAMR